MRESPCLRSPEISTDASIGLQFLEANVDKYHFPTGATQQRFVQGVDLAPPQFVPRILEKRWGKLTHRPGLKLRFTLDASTKLWLWSLSVRDLGSLSPKLICELSGFMPIEGSF